VDACTPKLIEDISEGTHISSITISFHYHSTSEVLRITLTDVVISAIQFDRSPVAGNTLPEENVTLSFAGIQYLDPATSGSVVFHRLKAATTTP